MYLKIHDNSKIKEFVLERLIKEKLIGNDSTVILTGSASIEEARASPNYDRYFNGESDIDLLVIIYNDFSFLDNLFLDKILSLFKNDKVNVLNYSDQYGYGRNSINIKFIKATTFNVWLDLKELSFKSYRTKPLTINKPNMKCYGLNDYKVISYQEIVQDNFYILHYNVVLENNYYLVDIHSMMLFGTIIKTCHLFDNMVAFNGFFKNFLKYPDSELFHLFSYYLNDKKQISDFELRNLIETFTNIYIADIIEVLKRDSCIESVSGLIDNNANIATVCWARSEPKEIFNFMNKISNQLSSNKFILLVDDLCPKVIYNRSDEEQALINNQYKKTFRDCKIYFSSDIFKTELKNNFPEEFFKIMRHISLNYYIEFLPKKKQEKLDSLNLGELIHTFFELFLIEYAENVLGIDTMIFGKFSQNVIFMIKQQTLKKSKLNYIIIPRLDEYVINSIFS